MKRIALVKDVTSLWTIYKPELEKYGFEVVLLDVFRKKDYERIISENWDAFIWRAKHDPKIRNTAKRLFTFFESELGIKTFPSWDTYWLYDDKIAQHMLLKKYNIPTPETDIFYDKEDALEFIRNRTEFPIVYKSSSGAGSSNVGLLKNKLAAKIYINKAFGKGIKTFFKEDLQRGYVYFQEFLKNNSGDYRIVCYEDKLITGFFRHNRDNNKFASGSGKFNFDPIPENILDFVFKTHKKLGSKLVMSYDVMMNNEDNPVITEISVVFGDISTAHVYNNAHKYLCDKNCFAKKDVDLNEFFIEILLKNWGWID